MRELDPGHVYDLVVYDGAGSQRLTFMKREWSGYPGNVGSYPGTNCQEVIRALIARTKYLDQQIPCPENKAIIESLRSAIIAFEQRAAHRHKRIVFFSDLIEDVPTCGTCGHIGCTNHGAAK